MIDDNTFYGVMKQVINSNEHTFIQIVEKKLIDFGMEYESIIDNGKFVTIKIIKTESLRIYSYLREINKIFDCFIRRKQVIVDRHNYYINVKKEKLLK